MAAPVERFAVARFAAGLLRDAVVAVDFALRDCAFAPVDFFARDVVLRAPVARLAAVRTVAAAADASSGIHLPESRRWAASATASAIREPSFVALAATLVAACCAVSAASSPASRILRRAAGLALIAAAAAAKPAASISLLIAAFASLSTVLLPDVDDDGREDDRLDDDLEDAPEELFLGDFAIYSLPRRVRKTL